MARLWTHLAAVFRFLVALLCVIVLSPLPDAPGTNTSAFLTMLSFMDGQPSVVIWKSQYSLTLYKGSTPVKTYRAVFGKGFADGDKEKVGDKRTPEGEFFVCGVNHSKRFYKFIGLSYPSLRHAEEGLRKGLISLRQFRDIQQALAERRQPAWETRLGGAIGIHGRMLDTPGVWIDRQNWTDGCVSLANADMDELFGAIGLGTQVTILP